MGCAPVTGTALAHGATRTEGSRVRNMLESLRAALPSPHTCWITKSGYDAACATGRDDGGPGPYAGVTGVLTCGVRGL
ncbi:hypothetical protein [Acetobacter okinawensis]|uniref:hypothetical protein n=1 Tax=Acetobacter okinawensis TaxID=1076594 RepID=UPI0011DCFCA5|nr:hypothetical protein [Acetobacter okinawensis]